MRGNTRGSTPPCAHLTKAWCRARISSCSSFRRRKCASPPRPAIWCALRAAHARHRRSWSRAADGGLKRTSASRAQVSGYIRTLDTDLGVFADELLAQAREAEAAALAAQAQRYEPVPVGLHVRAAPHCRTARRLTSRHRVPLRADGWRGGVRHAAPARARAAAGTRHAAPARAAARVQRAPQRVPAGPGCGDAHAAAAAAHAPAAGGAVPPAARQRYPGALVRCPRRTRARSEAARRAQLARV